MTATRIEFSNIVSKHYLRTYGNVAYIQPNPDGVTIDFCEEYVEPVVLMVQSFVDSEEDEYSRDSAAINVIREKKCTITINKTAAIRMANALIQALSDEEGEE